MRKIVVILCVFFLGVVPCCAKVRLPQIFQSGMVLQRNTEIPVWGYADPGETITVAAEDEHAALTVTIDLGETVDIHPLRKKEVAGRAALALEQLVWNPKVTLSPEVISVQKEGRTVVCTLSQPLLRDGALYEFEVAGSNGCYVNAEAEGCGSRILVKSSVESPVSIRYAWKNNPLRANVYGKNGLPMSPFQIDLSR